MSADFELLHDIICDEISDDATRDVALEALKRLQKSHEKLNFLRQRELQEKEILATLLTKTSHDLESALAQAQEAGRAKSAFLANVSHELRTPLNAIMGYVDLILTKAYGDLSTVQEDRLYRVRQNSVHLLALINDILDLSKIEAGKLEIVAQPFEVKIVSQQVIDAARALAARNNNQLVLNLPDRPGIMDSDPIRLRQILHNLLSNACKFTHEGTITLEVKRFSEGETEWVRFSVVDQGIGMSEDQLKHIYNEFVQVDSSTTRLYEGTGLGLAITRRLCDMLGGRILVDSVLDQGSVFTVEIPAFYQDSV